MQYILLFTLLSITVHFSVAPPVNQKTKNADEENKVDGMEDMEEIMEYRRYLMEVVQALESDTEFRAKLEKADEADIRTGKIAEQLEFVNHNVRSRLDELKREELERLRHLATKENEIRNGLDVDHLKIAEHVDHSNTHTFEIQDLKKLIATTTQHLAAADQRRREEFKHHEMQKKFEEHEKLKSMNNEEKEKYEQELEAMKEKQKKHEPVHHPGSKQQLEEVWEKQDHMDSEDFNPRTFFFMHDVDNNGVWDQDEVKALFLKELDKLYARGAPHEDLLKRTEEMERMREHVFNEADLNKDGMISYEEFLEETKKPDFQQDDGWQTLDEQQIYTQEEFDDFERLKQMEMQQMISKGMLPPHPGNVPAQHESFPPQYANMPMAPGAVPPQEYGNSRNPNQNLQHPQQFQDQTHPQYHQQQAVPQQQYPNQVPVQSMHGQVPQQQQYHPQIQQHQQFEGHMPQNQQYQQMPAQQLHPAQIPAQQHPGQFSAQQQQGQVPVQQQQQQGQVPLQQAHGQVPIQQAHGQVPIQQSQPGVQPNFQQQQNTRNKVPQDVQNNAVPQQNNPSQSNNPSQLNSQPAQPAAQPEVNRNQIQTGEKA